MDQAQPAVIPLTLSSSDAETFEHWREDWMLPMFRADIEAPDPARHRTRLTVLQLPKTAIIESRCTPSVLRRTRRLASDGDDGLLFHMPLRGSVDVRAGGEQVRLTAGQAMILPMNEENSLTAQDGIHGVSIRLSREVARGVVRGVEHGLRRPAPVDGAAGALLRDYVASLLVLREGLSPALAELADRHVRELMANAFDPLGDLARAAPYGGVRAGRLQAVTQEVARRLADPDLSAASVGRRLGLSERYVQQLMEGAGTSFSAFVRQRRLERALQLLRDPAADHLRVSDVADAAGFGDLSHFNREFRRRFGQTPRDARRRIC